ncbi:hypothetical protein [Pararhodospirillum oryzae]|uniref:Uncharacterized protein n=1 Tax=Pararhodospirillum oryzae TaxID=478448 RepID=A0A512HA24_9PROT|nr:hypothetical protein [Pararhodospirillum oryzae]GEO82295.1 hypothetical protein ROR02_24260 [Pararhodospirillum oryzae]
MSDRHEPSLRLGGIVALPLPGGGTARGQAIAWRDIGAGRGLLTITDADTAAQRQVLMARVDDVLRPVAASPTPAQAQALARAALQGHGLAGPKSELVLALALAVASDGLRVWPREAPAPVSAGPDLTRGHDALAIIAARHPDRLPAALRVLDTLACLPAASPLPPSLEH